MLTWLNNNLPTEVRRSDGVGQICLFGTKRTGEDLELQQKSLERNLAANQKWQQLLKNADKNPITYQTLKGN